MPSSCHDSCRRYSAAVSLADAPALLEQSQFVGRRLGADDIPRIERAIRRNSDRGTYFVITRHQWESARLNGVLPPRSLGPLLRALRRSDDFQPVYQSPDAWIFVTGRQRS